MANAVSSLREGRNYVHIIGTLEEKNLERVVVEGKNIIRGDLVISTAKDQKFKVNYYVNEFTSNGSESKAYKALNTIIDEYISRAFALENDLDESKISVVEVKGAFAINDFVSKKTGEIISSLYVRSMFASRVMGDYTPVAEFEVETYFESMEDEVDENGNATGRLVIEGITPIYGGQVIPIKMFTTTDTSYVNVADYLKTNYKTGKTGRVRGYLNCTAKTSTFIKEGFGAPAQERTFTTYSFEPIINDGDNEQYLITDAKNFDKASIKAAMLYREERLEEKKSKGSNTEKTATTSGFAAPKAETTAPVHPVASSSPFDNEDVEEIDF